MKLLRQIFLAQLLAARVLCAQGEFYEGLPAIEDMSTSVDRSSFKGSVAVEGAYVLGNSRNAAGYGIGTGIVYGITPKLGVGLGIRQTFYWGGVSPMFTMLDMKAVYSFRPNLVQENGRILVDGKPVLSSRTNDNGGFSIQTSLSQYLFNADASIVQLSGVGAGVIYDFPTKNGWNYHVGVRADILFSRVFVFFPFQTFFGISYWL